MDALPHDVRSLTVDGRVPFDLTHVEYEEGDVIGAALALFSLAPVYVTAAVASCRSTGLWSHVVCCAGLSLSC